MISCNITTSTFEPHQCRACSREGLLCARAGAELAQCRYLRHPPMSLVLNLENFDEPNGAVLGCSTSNFGSELSKRAEHSTRESDMKNESSARNPLFNQALFRKEGRGSAQPWCRATASRCAVILATSPRSL